MNMVINDDLLEFVGCVCSRNKEVGLCNKCCDGYYYCKDLSEEDRPDNWNAHSPIEVVTNRIVTVRRD